MLGGLQSKLRQLKGESDSSSNGDGASQASSLDDTMQKMQELTAMKEQLESSVSTLRKLREGASEGENPEEMMQKLAALRSKLLHSRSQLDRFDDAGGETRSAQYRVESVQGRDKDGEETFDFDGIVSDRDRFNDMEDDGDDDEFDYDFGATTLRSQNGATASAQERPPSRAQNEERHRLDAMEVDRQLIDEEIEVFLSKGPNQADFLLLLLRELNAFSVDSASGRESLSLRCLRFLQVERMRRRSKVEREQIGLQRQQQQDRHRQQQHQQKHQQHQQQQRVGF